VDQEQFNVFEISPEIDLAIHSTHLHCVYDIHIPAIVFDSILFVHKLAGAYIGPPFLWIEELSINI
jgi:hypothetical protein